jgi:cytochrome c-type biogenesis protein CcmH/NrfF
MLRKVLWALGVCVVVFAAFSIQDRRERKRRRELWAAATD